MSTAPADDKTVRAFDQKDLWKAEWFRAKLLKSMESDGFGQGPVGAAKGLFDSHPDIANFEDFAAKAAAAPGLAPVVKLWSERREYNRTIYSPANPTEYKARYWPNNTKLLQANWELFEDIYSASFALDRPRFITTDTPIASAGSCFAANIAYQLQEWGYNYLVEMGGRLNVDQPKIKWNPIWKWQTDFAGIGNIYNAMSLRQMVERAFGEWTPEKILLAREPRMYDPFRQKVDYSNDREYLAKFDEHTQALRRALMKCEVFILTLGLSEAWVFADSGLAMVGAPRKCDMTLMRAKNLTVQDNVDELERIHALFQKYNPKAKLIATVSPVPLSATYNMDKHIVVANSLSKSTLRVALEQFCNAHPGTTHYFPAYELVTVGSPKPWQIDMRHVSNTAIARVMKEFQNVFLVDQSPLGTITLPEMHEIVPTGRNYFVRYARSWIVHPLKRALGIEGKPFRTLFRRGRGST